MPNDDLERQLIAAEALERWRVELDVLEDRVRGTAAGLHFAGHDIHWEDGTEFAGITVNGANLGYGRDLDLDAAQAAALFLLLNRSRVDLRQVDAGDGVAPPGLYFYSMNGWIQPGHWNSVGIYTTVDGQGVYLNSFLDHIFYRDDNDVPDRLATAGFVLLAVAAHRLGFRKISLLAAGGAPQFRADWGAEGMIGYVVWPKFGFDAPVQAEEVAGVTKLEDCRTVQAVLECDPVWWEKEGGNGRVMEFDLTPRSASWSVLINYVKNWLDAEEDI